MPAIRGITVSVGQWYADLLRITLWRNLRHLTECVVVTAPGDPSIELASEVPGVRVFETTAFFDHGARFNKGLALELGFDFLGRHGHILIHDADVILPDNLALPELRTDTLYGARRRVLEDPSQWSPELNWLACPPAKDGTAPIGFFQLFHASAPAIRDVRPWYDVSFAHAGGGDAAFLDRWKRARQPTRVLPIELLHLGKVDLNWMGCDQESRDLMAKYVYQNRWPRAMKNFDPSMVERAGELPGRVQVPGYPPSNYQLPFERRAQQHRP